MKQEAIEVSKKKAGILTEEEQFLRKPEIVAAIQESEEAKKKGVKPWLIKY